MNNSSIQKIQEQLTFMQQEIVQLSEEVFLQQKEILKLNNKIKLLNKKLDHFEINSLPTDLIENKKPPHY